MFGAHRLLGSVADAEDVPHDVWLRADGPDAVYVTDGGGKIAAARKPVLVCYREGRVYSVGTVEFAGGLITAYGRVLNPEKRARARAVGRRGRAGVRHHRG
ncbi:hypothetical protein SAMN04489732_107171 [Amycolatopsis saalfeldensis]|uniref:Uncharacterized protein n=1 Tax=Amycolatopsis saalfeldensis TaxID=394193 RepID=A0A1H8XFI5_9PSEU|nr:hypothetical protein SAMN04489732_107171 [Amycolatopsis saalfeldensis]